MTHVRQPDERDYWPNNEIASRLGTWHHGDGKQPVVFLSINQDRVAVLNYETLTNLIDSLCRQKERLQEKLFAQANIPEKVLRFGGGK